MGRTTKREIEIRSTCGNWSVKFFINPSDLESFHYAAQDMAAKYSGLPDSVFVERGRLRDTKPWRPNK